MKQTRPLLELKTQTNYVDISSIQLKAQDCFIGKIKIQYGT